MSVEYTGTGGGDVYLRAVLASPASPYPLTMAGWAKPSGTGAEENFMSCVATQLSGPPGQHAEYRGTMAGDPFATRSWNGATFGRAVAASGSTSGVWQHFATTHSAANSRAVFIDGGSKGTNSTNVVQGYTLPYLIVGTREWGGPVAFKFEGKMGHIGVWDIVLSDAEIAELASGTPPYLVQAAHLIDYWSLISDGTSYSGGNDLSYSGVTFDDGADEPPVDTPPAITDQSTGDTYVVGDAVSLYITADGTEPLSYQWYKDGDPISGALSSTYDFTAADGDGGTYTCTVTNTIGSDTSDDMVIVVNVPPAISDQSGNQLLRSGVVPTTLYVVASGSPSPAYQWYVDDVIISGATSSTYSPVEQSGPLSLTYKCEVTNVAGSVFSNSMVITWEEPERAVYNILNLQLDFNRVQE